ncbi:General secretion pathway protein L [Candidatus Electrothrix laxa]
MAHLSFGIDISDDLLSGVAVAGNGKEAKAVSCAFRRLGEDNELAEQLPLLLKELQWTQKGSCDIGLALSELSLRNITLPFADNKKIEQILPFELDEQLLLPVDQQVIVTNASMVNKGEGKTQLMTAALEKETLSRYLSLLHEQGLEPNHISPTDFVLAERLTRSDRETENFLLFSCGLSGIAITVIHQGAVAFMRHLAYPTEVFTEALFFFDGKEIHTDDAAAAEQAVSRVCQAIERSLDLFRYQFSLNLQPDYILLTGPMVLGQGFQEKIEADIGLPVKKTDLIQADRATLSANIAGQWKPEIFDRPLALALQAGARKKTAAFNFRKNEFAPPHYLLRSKKQLAGAAITAGVLFLLSLGYLFVDARQLEKRHNNLSAQMVQVFRVSFPGINPSGDPLLHMRSKLQGMDTVSVAMPLFDQEKRILVILADISSRIPPSVDLHVTRLVINQDSVEINGTTDSYNSVNTITSLLDKSERYSEVKPGKSSKAKEGIRFGIELLLAKGGNS